MRLAAIALVLLGCSKGARDVDCAKVRKLVDAVPRRYREQPISEEDRAALPGRGIGPQTTYAQLDDLCMRDVKPRDHDCAEVRRVLGSGLALPPRPGEPGVFDPSLLQELARFDFRDAAVGKAVRELADTAATAYSPQGASPASLTRLRSLCPGLELR